MKGMSHAQVVFHTPHIRELIFAWRFRLMVMKFCHFTTDLSLFGDFPRPTKHPCARTREIARLITDKKNVDLIDRPLIHLAVLYSLGINTSHEVRLVSTPIDQPTMVMSRVYDVVSHLIINDPLYCIEAIAVTFNGITLDAFTYNYTKQQWTCKSFQPPYTPMITCITMYAPYILHFTTKSDAALQRVTMQFYGHFVQTNQRRILMDADDLQMIMHSNLCLKISKCVVVDMFARGGT